MSGCCRRLLRVPWTVRRSDKSILKEISAEYLLEGLITEAEAPILWPPNAKSLLIGKDPDAGRDWRQEEKGMTEDETVGCHHWLTGYEFEQTPGNSEGQGSLVWCSPWGHRVGHDLTTEQQQHWQLSVQSIVVLHWLSCESLIGWALAREEEKVFLLVIGLCYGPNVWQHPFLASQFYFNWGFCLLIFTF